MAVTSSTSRSIREDYEAQQRLERRGGSVGTQKFNGRSTQIGLTRLVIDWYFATDNNGEHIFIPIFTDFYYSDKFGGRGNIQHQDIWAEMGLPMRWESVEYRGNVVRRYDKRVAELADNEEGIRNELLTAITEYYEPKPAPYISTWNKFKWAFFGLLLMNIVIFILLIRGAMV